MIRFLSATLLLAALSMGQIPNISGVVKVAPYSGGYLALFADGSFLYGRPIDPDWQWSYSGGLGSLAYVAQGQVSPPAQGPTLTTTWIDKAGVTHSVSTPVASNTPAGVQRAVDTHNQLVSVLQALHPPRPNP